MLRASDVIAAGGWSGVPADTVVLDYDERHRRRVTMIGVRGLEFLLDLEEAVMLRGGDGLKLDSSLALIQAAVKKAGRFAELRVYVAGHTDTVGSDESNQALSEARARSIGAYFAAHGLRVPVYYAGFGEKALAVPTPDETAEPGNRRAEYIVAITDPPIAHATVPAHWKRL